MSLGEATRYGSEGASKVRNSRIMQMESYILEHQSVTLEELSAKFGMSMNTVRRDIGEILKNKQVEKVYGGVRAVVKPMLLPFDERNLRMHDAKLVIGRLAAAEVVDGDSIFVDSGTTTLNMIPHLKNRVNVTIITYSASIIFSALPYKNITVIMLPGVLDRKTNSFTGLDTTRALSAFNVKKAFMAATALSLAGGATNSSPLEFEIKRMAVERSEKVYLLVDAGKFDKAALITYAKLGELTAVISDRRAPHELSESMDQLGVRQIVPEGE